MSTNSPSHLDDDSVDIDLRSVDEVARRAVLLTTLFRRASMEQADPESDDSGAFERETNRFELYSWAKAELAGVWSDEERSALQTPVSELTDAQLDDCLAALLPAAALCWTLNVVDRFDLNDVESAIERLLAWAPSPWDDLDGLVRKSSLKPEVEIAGERERWELWWWRLAIAPDDFASLQEMGAVVRETAEEAHAAGLIEMVEGDFAFEGRPVASLPAELIDELEDISRSYLRALNWVARYDSG